MMLDKTNTYDKHIICFFFQASEYGAFNYHILWFYSNADEKLVAALCSRLVDGIGKGSRRYFFSCIPIWYDFIGFFPLSSVSTS